MLYVLCSYIYGLYVYKISWIFLNSMHGKVVFVHATKVYNESRDVASLILDLSNRRRWAVYSTPRPFYSLERTLVPIQ